MRFLAPSPPPDLVARPPAAAPPQPVENTAAGSDVVLPATAVLSVAPEAAPASIDAETAPADNSSTGVRTPPPILVDELRPHVRAEDFLPYFQIPAEHPGAADVIVPIPRGATQPAPLPTSSATYTQTPR